MVDMELARDRLYLAVLPGRKQRRRYKVIGFSSDEVQLVEGWFEYRSGMNARSSSDVWVYSPKGPKTYPRSEVQFVEDLGPAPEPGSKRGGLDPEPRRDNRPGESVIQPTSVSPLEGKEKFKGADATVLDFWRWSGSDLRMNTVRPMVAEFLVAQAVADRRPLRIEWADYDVLSEDGIRVEVKSSAYCQSWTQKRLSKITFGRFRGRSWDPETGEYGKEAIVRADVFVFAVQTCRDCDEYDALDVSQWEFYVLPSEVIERYAGRTASLSFVRTHAGEPVAYEELGGRITAIAVGGGSGEN